MSDNKPKSYAMIKSGIIKSPISINGHIYLQDALKKDLIDFQAYYGHSTKTMSDIFKLPEHFFKNVKYSYYKKQKRIGSLRWKMSYYEKRQAEIKAVIDLIEESEYWAGRKEYAI